MDNQRIEFTPEVIAQQRAICDAATPGPWKVDAANEYPYDDIGSGLTGEHVALCGSKAENSKFIIDARTILPAALDALEASMAREAEKDKRCKTWRKAAERLAEHEKDLQQTIAALTESNKDALKDVLYYKAYNDRLRNALSRPELDYLDEIDRLTAERDAEKRRADAACNRSCHTCKYHGLQYAESRYTETPHQRVFCNLPKNHLYACISRDQWKYASPDEIKAINFPDNAENAPEGKT